MRKIIALLTLVLVLAVVNWSIYGKEKHLSEGKVVYLNLAPVDPRSLMQGDYMALRFAIAREVYNALPKSEEYRSWQHNADASDGHVVVSLDDKHVASFKAIYKDQTLSEDEILIRYRVRNGAVKFATNAYFFQEGHAKYYEKAKYGQFRVNDGGDVLLVDMYDQALNKLGPVEN
jgi:uncharacterized membrane-anchored protein